MNKDIESLESEESHKPRLVAALAVLVIGILFTFSAWVLCNLDLIYTIDDGAWMAAIAIVAGLAILGGNQLD